MATRGDCAQGGGVSRFASPRGFDRPAWLPNTTTICTDPHQMGATGRNKWEERAHVSRNGILRNGSQDL